MRPCSSDHFPSQDEEASSPDIEALKVQNGVLRTNCIDCLDRTNFAQFAFGLVALEHQLQTLGIEGPPIVDVNNPLALRLMNTYQNMGDTIAQQYGGSEAHSKVILIPNTSFLVDFCYGSLKYVYEL